MKTAIIIHGYNDKSEFEDTTRPAASNDHWMPWLQRQLLLNGIEAQTPEMPGFYEPIYEKWKVVLVAPWLDLENVIDPDFFNFEIDQHLSDKTAGVTIMYSTDDDASVIKSVETLKNKLLKTKFVEFHDKGHFVLNSLGTDQFPELLKEIIH